jgi:hypothetical protein
MKSRVRVLSLGLAIALSANACASAPSDDASAGGDGGALAEDGGARGDASESDAIALRDASSIDGSDGSDGGGSSDAGASDGTIGDGAAIDAAAHDANASDASVSDGAAIDSGAIDAGALDAQATDSAIGGIISGGPCLSGAAGRAAYRVRWMKAGSQAQVVYEVDGLPDHSRDRAGAYGYQIGFTSSFVDPFLAQGGLQVDSSDFVDLEISTAGISSIASATLSIYGRSFDTTTSGSFNWQTFTGVGQTPTDLVSNVAPYAWYSADMTSELAAGDANVLVRIKAGPSSGVLVVNRIEICMQAE